MQRTYEFEVYEDDGWLVAEPFGLPGGTQGRDGAEVAQMAADWLRTAMEEYALHGEEPPEPTYGNAPANGGRIMVVSVQAGLETVERVSAAEAARMLGVTPGRVSQMLKANLLSGWREGGRTWVAADSVRARLAESPRAGRPRAEATKVRDDAETPLVTSSDPTSNVVVMRRPGLRVADGDRARLREPLPARQDRAGHRAGARRQDDGAGAPG